MQPYQATGRATTSWLAGLNCHPSVQASKSQKKPCSPTRVATKPDSQLRVQQGQARVKLDQTAPTDAVLPAAGIQSLLYAPAPPSPMGLSLPHTPTQHPEPHTGASVSRLSLHWFCTAGSSSSLQQYCVWNARELALCTAGLELPCKRRTASTLGRHDASTSAAAGGLQVQQ